MSTVTGAATVGGVRFPVSAQITLPTSAIQTRVGNILSNLSLQAGAYDAGLTQAQADTKFCQIVGRGLGGGQHLTITKKFWGNSNYSMTRNDLANYAAFGTTVIFALTPAFPVTLAEQSSLSSFLSAIKSLGFNASTAYIVLWQEPEVAGKLTAAEYQTMLEGYGPIVNNAGLPLVCDIGSGAGVSALQAYGNAAIAALNAGVKIAGLAQDFYGKTWAGGATLDTLMGLADASGIGFGVFESGCEPSNLSVTLCTTYLNYIGNKLVARKTAGKPTLGWLYYNGNNSPTGDGQTSPIGQDPSVAQPDFRIALYQKYYDALCGMS